MSIRESTHSDDSDLRARIAALEAESTALRAQLKGHQAAASIVGAERDAGRARAQDRASAGTTDRLALGTLEQANAALRLVNAN